MDSTNVDQVIVRERRRIEAFLKLDDGLGVVIRGHVYVERALEEIISAFLARPLAFGRLELTANHKIHLAFCLGIIDEPELRVLKALNTLRNKVAHRHDFEPDASDESQMIALLEEAGFPSEFLSKDVRFPQGLGVIYLAVWLLLNDRKRFVGKRQLVSMVQEYKADANENLTKQLPALAALALILAMILGLLKEDLTGPTDSRALSERADLK